MDNTSDGKQVKWPDCHKMFGYSGAATAIDGAVLAGALNGKLSAFASDTGTPISMIPSAALTLLTVYLLMAAR